MTSVPADSLRSRISAHVVSRIMSGTWEAGMRIPSENALAETFAASRMTVHHALRDLTNRGFLVRRSGSGTYVASPRNYVAEYDHLDVIAQIESRGGVHDADVLARRMLEADQTQAVLFDVAQGTPLFHALVLHRDDGVPVQLEDRLIDPAAMPDCMTVDLTKQTLFSRLMLLRPYRVGSETVRAVIPDADERRMLELPVNAACLEVSRRMWSDLGVVTHARLLMIGADAMLKGTVRPVT